MLVHGEPETIARVPERFSLLLNDGSVVYGAHASSLLSSLVCNWNLHEMKRRSLVVFAGDPPEDPGLVSLGLCL